MQRKKQRGDLTTKKEYRSNQDIKNEIPCITTSSIDMRRKVNDLTYAKTPERP